MKSKLIKFLTVTLATVILTACATTTGDAGKDARGRATNAALSEAGKVLGKIAVASLYNVAQQHITGQNVDFTQAATAGLWSQSTNILSGTAVANVINAYSGNQVPDAVVNEAVDAFRTSAASPEARVAAIASVISTATGAPPRVTGILP